MHFFNTVPKNTGWFAPHQYCGAFLVVFFFICWCAYPKRSIMIRRVFPKVRHNSFPSCTYNALYNAAHIFYFCSHLQVCSAAVIEFHTILHLLFARKCVSTPIWLLPPWFPPLLISLKPKSICRLFLIRYGKRWAQSGFKQSAHGADVRWQHCCTLAWILVTLGQGF